MSHMVETGFFFVVAVSLFCITVSQNNTTVYEANWDSLDSRPLPEWFDEAKIGIFLHWGLYAVPAISDEWFWHGMEADYNATRVEEIHKYMEENYKPGFKYAQFAKDFTTELFNPDEWADIFNASGAKYSTTFSYDHLHQNLFTV